MLPLVSQDHTRSGLSLFMVAAAVRTKEQGDVPIRKHGELIAVFRSVKPVNNIYRSAQVRGIDPGVERQLGRKMQIHCIGDIHIIGAVEAECLTYFACAVSRSSAESPVVVVLAVVGVRFGFPPTDHSARRFRARSTFTRASRIVDT